MSEKNFVAYGDAESILTGYANRIKQSPTTFVGTQAQWNALSSSQKAEYELVDITDDSLSLSGLVDWRSNGELGAKNLIENTSVSKTDGNVQYTVNADKSISINILSSLSANAGRIVGYINVKAGLSYTLRGGISSTIRIDLRNSDYSMWMDNVQNKEVTSPKQSYSVDTFIPSNDATLMVYLRIDSSIATGNAGTVYPLLRFATDTDETYQPYAMTNKEMTPYVQAISNPNLLDNPWFTVNQRGLSSYSGAAQYTVDRWKLVNNKGELTVNSDGSITIIANGGDTWLQHRIEPSVLKSLVGKTITLSIDAVKTGGYVNLYSGYYDSANTWHRISDDIGINTTRSIVSKTVVVPTLVDNNPNFAEYGIYIANGQSVTIYSTKLELGEISTLSMDFPPNYAEELAKCQRYFARYASTANNSSISFGAIATVNKQWYGVISLPVVMRAVPTITYNGTVLVYFEANSALNQNISTIAISNMMANVGKLRANFADTTSLTVGMTGELQLQNGAYIDFSADL